MPASTIKTIFELLKTIFREFQRDNVIALSASIAFYTIFSLPGMLILIIRVTGLFIEEEMIKGTLAKQIGEVAGESAAREVQKIIENADLAHTTPLMTVVGLSILAFSASSVFTIIQSSLNTIWGVRPKPKKGILKLVKNRILSFLMVLFLGMLVLLSIFIDLFMTVFRDMLVLILPGALSTIVPLMSAIISFLILAIAFAFIFKVLPDVRVPWKDVAVGALVTTLLFTIGKYLIGIYLSTSNFNTTYGAAGSIVLILIWVNYSAMIMLLGVEFTQAYAQAMGHKVTPSPNTVQIERKEIDVNNS